MLNLVFVSFRNLDKEWVPDKLVIVSRNPQIVIIKTLKSLIKRSLSHVVSHVGVGNVPILDTLWWKVRLKDVDELGMVL